MKRAGWMLVVVTLSLLVSSSVTAHDKKEYTVILGSEGARPSSIDAGILVETDSIFFRNHDSRENATHRILIDADSDGSFDSIDDIYTDWMYTSCELNQTGHKVDESCNTSATVLLAPENGLLPGNISMIHRVKYYEQVTDTPFYAVFSIDDHSQQNALGPQGPHVHTETEDSDAFLRGVVVIMAGISIWLTTLLISPRGND